MKCLAGYWYSLVVLVVIIFALNGAFVDYTYTGWHDALFIEKLGIPTVFITFVGFWLMMLEDFMTNDDTKFRFWVGVSLFFLHWIAILLYFWLVVHRRKPNRVSNFNH